MEEREGKKMTSEQAIKLNLGFNLSQVTGDGGNLCQEKLVTVPSPFLYLQISTKQTMQDDNRWLN